ncbi:extracellular solute-binding protein [Paenibacillus sp. J5C_2022]|uniref:ABC transporter substrate-binding protein n=1 Tax=Paenibacillus sp. J5C2022 TaxID=2977129 RepID=UPI0021D1A0AF|nr:extracellular solute-binding protein [Paenibacillus sp. J5C2022]MCU6712346.1 extracellular solute-binding protein [Paenibacillus sp. J5C2022]
MQKWTLSKGIVLLLVLALVLVMAGCSGNNGQEEAPGKETVKETATPAPETTEEKPDDGAVEEKIDLGGQTIKIGAWWDADPRAVKEEERSLIDELQIELIEKAEKKYNAKIEYVKVDYGQMVEQFTTTSLGGEPFADIVRLELFWMFPKLVNDGFVAELDDLLKIDSEKMPKWMLEGGAYNGKQYGLVDGGPSPFGLWYNKTLFQSMGLEDPYALQQSGEWTWDKFLEIAKAATKDTDGDGKVDVYGIAGNPKEIFHQYIYSNNGAVDVAEDGSYKFSLDSPNAMEASQAYYDLYNTHKVIDVSGEDHNQQFIKGKTAMVTAFTWEIGNYKENMTDELGFVFWPRGPKADDYGTNTPFGNMWAIAKMSKNAEAAAKILDEISLWRSQYPEIQALIDESMENTYPSPEIIDTIKQMGNKITYISYYAYPEAEKIIEGAFNNMKDGKETPATAIEKIKPQFEAAMNQVMK